MDPDIIVVVFISIEKNCEWCEKDGNPCTTSKWVLQSFLSVMGHTTSKCQKWNLNPGLFKKMFFQLRNIYFLSFNPPSSPGGVGGKKQPLVTNMHSQAKNKLPR